MGSQDDARELSVMRKLLEVSEQPILDRSPLNFASCVDFTVTEDVISYSPVHQMFQIGAGKIDRSSIMFPSSF